jgi:beta-galactosidase
MKILKDMGCNAIQFAQMPSFEQLELADEMGFMFWQSFDEWVNQK